jgi:hypothetical protein
MHLMLLGTIDAVLEHPAIGMYDLQIVEAPRLVDDATRRIRQAARKYHLDERSATNLTDQFLRGADNHR